MIIILERAEVSNDDNDNFSSKTYFHCLEMGDTTQNSCKYQTLGHKKENNMK